MAAGPGHDVVVEDVRGWTAEVTLRRTGRQQRQRGCGRDMAQSGAKGAHGRRWRARL